MAQPDNAPASAIERTYGFVAVALSQGGRHGARLVSGERRSFATDSRSGLVDVPYPPLARDWTLRTLTCGVALQCAPSKGVVARHPLHELTPRQLRALTIVEGRVAAGWLSAQWPGLVAELRRHLPDFDGLVADDAELFERAMDLAASRAALRCHPLLGRLIPSVPPGRGLSASARRMYGRMPWSSKKTFYRVGYSVPVGGEGGVRNPNLPPPSRPEDEEIEIRSDERPGIPYPEWNAWTERFLPHHVAVLERKHSTCCQSPRPVSPNIQRWFEEHTHRVMNNRREDGADLDIDAYVDHHVDLTSGHQPQGRVFRDLVSGFRDVTTALLLDGSSSLGIHGGRIFRLELACADALSHAMRMARERHGVFVFSGNTRHRVEIRCLKDFNDRNLVVPSGSGLVTGGYTRLGAPLRHLTSRLVQQRSERRLLIVIGDGLPSDEGYEGRYAWADVAHSVAEADDAGVSVYYIGVGPARVDPLPEVFGPRRSKRIRRIEDLPNVLAHVHRELVAA